MSRARSSADMEKLRAPFVEGAHAKGVSGEIAHEIFRQIAAFAEFGFCKSHAAAFALTAYHTAHLKLYYPAEFYVGLFNNQPMGFYSPAVIAGDAKRHGVAILPVDVDALEGEGDRRRVLAGCSGLTCRLHPRSDQLATPDRASLARVAFTTCGSASSR